MFEWVQKWQDIAKTKNKWCIHCRRLQFYWYTFYFDGFLVDVIEIHSICHCRISLRICLQKLNCNVIRQSGNVSVNVVYCLFFFPVSFSIRFSFSHLIKWTPFFLSICRKQLFPFFVNIVQWIPTAHILELNSQWCIHIRRIQNHQEMKCQSKKHGSEQIWWCFICEENVTLDGGRRLLMVLDHKLINYGLLWMSVSGL